MVVLTVAVRAAAGNNTAGGPLKRLYREQEARSGYELKTEAAERNFMKDALLMVPVSGFIAPITLLALTVKKSRAS